MGTTGVPDWYGKHTTGVPDWYEGESVLRPDEEDVEFITCDQCGGETHPDDILENEHVRICRGCDFDNRDGWERVVQTRGDEERNGPAEIWRCTVCGREFRAQNTASSRVAVADLARRHIAAHQYPNHVRLPRLPEETETDV